LAGTVSDNIYVQYVGFEAMASVRQYIFCVREVSNEPREFILTIANEAFVSHRARYQDAPDICSLKLRHELAIYANHPPKTQLCISDEELENYRDAHGHKPVRVAHHRERFQSPTSWPRAS
jgi:hypothetical protein